MTVFSPLHHTGSAVPSGNPLLCLAVKQGKKNTKYIWGNNHKMWKHLNYILNLWDSVWFTLKTSQPGGDYLDWVLLLCELKLFNHSCNTNARPRRERNLGMKKNNTTKETWRTWFCSFSPIAAKIIHQVHDLKKFVYNLQSAPSGKYSGPRFWLSFIYTMQHMLLWGCVED